MLLIDITYRFYQILIVLSSARYGSIALQHPTTHYCLKIKPPRAYAHGIFRFFGVVRVEALFFYLRASEGSYFSFIIRLMPEVFCEGG